LGWKAPWDWDVRNRIQIDTVKRPTIVHFPVICGLEYLIYSLMLDSNVIVTYFFFLYTRVV
jgi:hypothetical protein